MGYGVATDGSGNVFITGWTYSTSAIATTGAYQTSFGGTRDAFLAKFNSSGAIQWATYYGGSNGEFGFGVATDGSGNVFITGSTSSTSAIATSGAYQTTLGSSQNAFLAKFQFVAPIVGTAAVCIGSTTTLSDATTGGTWSSGSTAVATVGTTGVVTGVTSGTATISYSVSGSTPTITVTVNPLPASITGTTNVCAGLTTALTDATTGGTWSSSNTSNATVGSGTGVVTGVSAGTVTISYTLPTGCITTTSVTVNPLPASITGTANVCAGLTTLLTDATTGGSWSSGNTSLATVGSGTGVVMGVSIGSASITYKLSTGCIMTTPVTVNPLPAAITGTANVCVGLTTALTDASTGGTWSSSNTSLAAVGSTGVVTGVSAGTTTITYMLSTGCIMTTPVTVNPLPAAITGTANVCAGLTTALTDASTGGTWSSSNTSFATVSGIGIVSGVSAGIPGITYKLSTGCIITTPVTVNPLPAAITGTANVCVGLTTTLTDATTGGTWSSSNTSLATVGGTGIVTGVSAGNPNITYTLSTGCIMITPVTVNPLPAVITGTTNVCAGLTTALTDATTGGTWSSSNTSLATIGGTGIVTGVMAGNSNITYTLSTGCIMTTPVTVNPLPAGITGTANVCVGLTTALTDATTGGTWSSGNTSLATVISGTGIVTGVSTGTPAITYKLSTGCMITTTVTVNPLPAAITGTKTVCAGLTTTLTDATTGGTWSSSNTGLATVGGTGVVTGVSGGNPQITYTLSTGCIMTTPVTVNPISAITGTANVCAGLTTALTDAATGGTWSSSNTTLATVSGTGIVTGVLAGTPVITYKLSTGCIMTTPVTVNPLPSGISGTKIVCAGLTTNLSDAGGGTWSSSNISLATVDISGMVTGVAAGVPKITYTLSTGCIITTPVTVNPSPAAITGTANVCAGLTTALTDVTTGGTWSSSNTSVATVSGTGVVAGLTAGTPLITYSMPTGCIMTMPVTVNPLPGAISGIANVCAGLTTTLSDAGGGAWSSSNISLATVDISGMVTGISAGTPKITYTMSTGCITTIPITVNPLPAGVSGTKVVCEGLTTNLSDVTTGGKWSSSNTSLATIGSGTGVVTGVAAGSPDITYTLSTGCVATTPVTVNPLPLVYTVTGGGYYCAGDTGVHITLSGSTSGNKYQLYYGGIAIGTAISGTGLLLDFGLHTAAGTYKVVAKDAITACTNNMFDSATITINPVPLAITGFANVCAGLTTNLSDATTAGTWSCSNTALATVGSTGVVTGAVAGAPTITYTLSTGCMATTPVTVNPLPTAITGTTNVCAGSTTALTDATISGTWGSSNTSLATVGAGTGIVSGVSAGNPNITYTLSTGCITTIPVTVNPLPATITGTANVCAGLTTTLSDGTAGGTWSSGSTAIATVGSTTGTVNGVTAGTSVITYTLVTGCAANNVITVNPLPSAIAGTTHVCVNATTGLSDLSGSGAWSAGNTTIATVVAATGVVTGVSSGTSAITYTLPTGCITNTTVTVNPLPYAGTITGATFVCPDSTITLSDAITGGIWSSNNNNANVTNAGVVTGVATGTDTIIYSVTNVCGTDNAKWALNIIKCDFTIVHAIANPLSELKVYPNPNEGMFTIKLMSESNEQVSIVITNLLEQKVKEITTVTNQPVNIKLDVAAGVYLISANTEHGKYVGKVTIQ